MKKMTLLLSALILVSLPVMAQDENDKTPPPPTHFYHLIYVVQDVSDAGKVTNSRVYTTNAKTGKGEGMQIRASSKVAVCTDPPERCADKAVANHNISYIDNGVSIDTRNLEEINGKLALRINAELHSPSESSSGYEGRSVTRDNSWSTYVLVPIGKPTVIFAGDNPDNKNKIQVELTPTRIE